MGGIFEGAIVEIDKKDPQQGEVMLREPAILARVSADRALPLGEQVVIPLRAGEKLRWRLQEGQA